MIEETAQQNPKKGYFSKFKNWVSFLTLLFIAAYTMMTLFLVLQGRENIDSNNESNAAITRAWIQADPPIAVNLWSNNIREPYVTLSYKNSGREPAFGVSGRARIDVIPAARGENVEWTNLPVWDQLAQLREDRICEGVMSKSGREVLYVDGVGGAPIRSERDSTIQIDSARNRLGLLIVYGCLAYRTPIIPKEKGDRQSTFCWFYRPDSGIPPEQWQTARCPIGNYAH